METVKIGVIGFGNMGSVHASSLCHGLVPHMVLTAICDADPEKRKSAAALYPGIPVFDTHRALLEANLCDAVIIATPHYLHSPIAIDAFRAGYHVISEKPGGVYTRQVREMTEAAKTAGRVFGIMFNQRTNPLFARARELVQSGALGEPKRLVWIVTNWYRTQAYYDSGTWRATWSGEGGGVLLNQAPHNLDLWQWIFGMPKRVRASCRVAQYHHIEVEDDATIQAEYENGASALFITATGEYPGTNRLEISGDLGKMVLENGKLKLWLLPEHERHFCFASDQGFYQPKVKYSETEFPTEGGAHNEILENFALSVLNGTPLLAPGEEALKELTLSNAAYLSSWEDRFVDLPFDEADFEAQLKRRAETGKQTSYFSEPGHDNTADKTARWKVRW